MRPTSDALYLRQVRQFAASQLGKIVTETLECEPRRWKVVQHVRETMTCRDCESITETPAPSHPIARGRAGPHLLAMVLASKYDQHLPLTQRHHRGADAVRAVPRIGRHGALSPGLQPLAPIRANAIGRYRVWVDGRVPRRGDRISRCAGKALVEVQSDHPFPAGFVQSVGECVTVRRLQKTGGQPRGRVTVPRRADLIAVAFPPEIGPR